MRLYLSFGEGLGGEAFFRSIQVHIPFLSFANEKNVPFFLFFSYKIPNFVHLIIYNKA